MDLDCKKCSDTQKKLYGCIAPPTAPSTWPFKGEYLNRCPMRFVTHGNVLYIKYYGFFKQGFLVNGGAIGHQPAKMVDAFAIIEDEKYHIAKEKAEEK